MKKILVTGAAGFIGSDFVDLILEAHPDAHVVALDKLGYAGDVRNLEGALESGRVEFVHGDVVDPVVADRVVQGVDYVAHFAAESSVDRSVHDPMTFVRSNVEGTCNLLRALRAARSLERVLYVSTPEVYGQRLDDPAGETDGFYPRNVYAASKAGAEMVCRAFIASFGMPLVFTRGAVAMGPRQYPEKAVSLWSVNAILGIDLPVFGDGTAVRDFVHVRDLNRANELVLRTGVVGEAYNVTAFERSIGQLADAILARVPGTTSRPRQTPSDRPGHDYRYHMDGSKMRALGWEPTLDFEEALDHTVDWYKSNGSWWAEKIGLAADHMDGS